MRLTRDVVTGYPWLGTVAPGPKPLIALRPEKKTFWKKNDPGLRAATRQGKKTNEMLVLRTVLRSMVKCVVSDNGYVRAFI